jgi:hypothetical protein
VVDNLFPGVVISVLADHLVDFYLSKAIGKVLWDALEANFCATDAGSKLYVMEKFDDYKMVDDCPVVEQSHEIHTPAKELEGFKCKLSPFQVTTFLEGFCYLSRTLETIIQRC